MNKTLFITITLVTLLFASTNKVFAEQISESAQLITKNERICYFTDERKQKLYDFLTTRNSPLADHVDTLINQADENQLDYRLVAAISGVESGYGKHIPYGSYNAYGWGNGKIYFQNWEEGIIKVSQTLNKTYAQKWNAITPDQIGKYYAASPTWAQRVNYNMNLIENHQVEDTLQVSL